MPDTDDIKIASLTAGNLDHDDGRRIYDARAAGAHAPAAAMSASISAGSISSRHPC